MGMSYTLILAEKPSAAKKIAEALTDGKIQQMKRNNAPYYRITRSGKSVVVVPAVGHLFVLSDPGKNSKWTYPVFAAEWKPTFQGKANAWAKKYYSNIQALVREAGEFISATDYDVEGSVIAYNIFRFLFKQNDGKRMKFSTLTQEDIVDAYENMSKHLDFPMIEAGLTRHHLDWYFGINLSRALTLSLEHVGGYWVLSTGRVQGPTLMLLNKRQKEIKAFKPVPYWLLELKGIINKKEIKALHINDKFWKKGDIEAALKRCMRGKVFRDGIVQEVKKSKRKEMPPFPFDLTTLQRESYSLFGYSPKMTLEVAQSLYEHALISYPRTSSQKLPAKLGFRKILSGLSRQKEYSGFCQKLLQGKLKPNEGRKDDPAHPAIFPTGLKPKRLGHYQKRVYDLIVRRFLSVFGEPAVREQVRILINVNDELFAAHGITTVERGWLEFYGPYSRVKEQALHDMNRGDVARVSDISIIDKETEPPPRYSQASIIKEMEALNLGTKATRAGILQTLYDRNYIKGRSIEVTELGEAVTEALQKHCPEIVSVDLTKRFEEDMNSIIMGREKGEEVVSRAKKELERILQEFKKHEKDIGRDILKAVKEYEEDIHTVGKCPKCRSGRLHIIHSHKTGKRFVGCTNYPKCKNSYPLPGAGYLTTIDRTCSKCGLRLVEVRRQGRRPFRLCVVHGFEYYDKKERMTGKSQGKQKQAK